ncbi:hypothetical protein I4U23_002991 [Adineta vaga]|nr:hypothetical protein I4U23_002991 [Adineta vaga]
MPGFNCSNIKEIVKNYVCPDCDLILKDPIQLDCGHRICEECIKHDEELIQCKQCSEETEKKELFHDVGFKNEMKSISLRCSNCQWNGSLKDYENHLTANHINSSSNEYDQCPIIAQAQRFRKEYGKPTRKWRKIISKKLNCKLVMEEQNPPVFHPQRVELCCIPTNGGLFLKIDDLKKRLSK